MYDDPQYNPEPSDDQAYEDSLLAEFLADAPDNDIDWDFVPVDIVTDSDPTDF